MRRTVIALVALTAGGCAKTVPLTPDLRANLTEAGTLAALNLRVLGSFELRSGSRTTVTVKNEATGFGARATSDTTIVLRVLASQMAGSQDTLDLTFALSQAARGVYTLRAVNGTPLGRTISIGNTSYQYVPCYQNVGSKCLDPIADGATEDRQVRLGIKQ